MRKYVKAGFAVIAIATSFMLGNPASLWASPVPEIDPSSGMAAMALLAGAILVIRGRRKN